MKLVLGYEFLNDIIYENIEINSELYLNKLIQEIKYDLF